MQKMGLLAKIVPFAGARGGEARMRRKCCAQSGADQSRIDCLFVSHYEIMISQASGYLRMFTCPHDAVQRTHQGPHNGVQHRVVRHEGRRFFVPDQLNEHFNRAGQGTCEVRNTSPG